MGPQQLPVGHLQPHCLPNGVLSLWEPLPHPLWEDTTPRFSGMLTWTELVLGTTFCWVDIFAEIPPPLFILCPHP
jgi:hypothetical protein